LYKRYKRVKAGKSGYKHEFWTPILETKTKTTSLPPPSALPTLLYHTNPLKDACHYRGRHVRFTEVLFVAFQRGNNKAYYKEDAKMKGKKSRLSRAI
jgi:hypothetical protein